MIATQRSFYQADGGSLAHDAPSYVERAADRELFEALCQGEFCYVLTSRQMGKSSLMVRTTFRLREAGHQVVLLDLSAMGENLSPEQWYLGLLGVIGHRLDLEDELDDFWFAHEHLGPLRRWMEALREVVLPALGVGRWALGVKDADETAAPSSPNAQRPTPNAQGRLVIFIDEIDVVGSLPFSTDEFFAAIRECYNRRTEDAAFERLTFCLLGVATPSDLIRDTRTTPFNIGRRIELHDFSEEEAAPLRIGLALGSPETLGTSDAEARALLERILYWTGGHPYLTQRLCRAVVDRQASAVGRSENLPVDDGTQADRPPHLGSVTAEVDRLCDELFLSPRAREQDTNLMFVRNWLLRSEVDRASLLDLYGQARRGKQVALDSTSPLVESLRLAGIVRVEEARSRALSLTRALALPRLRVRNPIYAHVFDLTWVKESMPDAEVRRQRAAYRKGLFRTAAVAGVILVAMGGLAFSELRQMRMQAQQTRMQQEALAQEIAFRDVQREKDKAVLAQKGEHEQKVAAERARQLAATSALAATRNAASARVAAQRAHEQEQRAQDERRRADAEAVRARLASAQEVQQRVRAEGLAESIARAKRHQSYASQMHLAYNAWEAGDAASAEDLLTSLVPAPGQEDVRGWEWRYLWQLTRRDDSTATLLPRAGAVYSVAFSPDGRRVAAASWRSSVRTWDVATQRLMDRLPGIGVEPNSLAFSPDGTVLAVGYQDNTLRLWDLATRKVVHALPGQMPGSLISPDGRLLATRGVDKIVRLWDLHGAPGKPALTEIARLQSHPNGVNDMAFSADSRTLVTVGASSDLWVRLWDLRGLSEHPTPREAARWEAVGGPVSSLALSPDGQTLATGIAATGVVKLWEAATGKPRGILTGHRPGQLALVIARDGKWLAAASDDCTVKLWNLETQEEIATLRGHRNGITSLALSPDGTTLATGALQQDAVVKLWRVSTAVDDRLRGHRSAVRALLYTPDGKQMLSGSTDGVLKIWDATAGQAVDLLTGSGDLVRAMALSPNGRLLAAGTARKTVAVWDLAARRIVATFPWTTPYATAVAFSPDGRLLALGGEENTTHVWSLSPRKEVATLEGSTRMATGEQAAVVGLAFSPDGRLLAAAGAHAVKLWDVRTRKEAGIVQSGSKAELSTIAFSPDGRVLVAADQDKLIRVWDVATRRGIATLRGHTQPVPRLGFTPDGTRLVTASFDGTIRFWSVQSWLETAVLPSPGLMPTGIALSPDGSTVASGLSDGGIRLWRAPSMAEAEAQARLAWHARAADDAEAARDWAAAVTHFSYLIAAEPEQAGPRLGHRMEALAEMGCWREAADDARRFHEFDPDWTGGWHREALLRMVLGDQAGYRRVCTEMRRHFARSDNPGELNLVACACVWAAGAVEDPRIPVQWAERAVAARPDNGDMLTTLGAALYREGRFEAAIPRLIEATKKPGGSLIAEWLFLAMAHARLGHREEARRWYDRADRQFDEALKRKPGNPGEPPLEWYQRLLIAQFRREAEGVLKMTGGKAR